METAVISQKARAKVLHLIGKQTEPLRALPVRNKYNSRKSSLLMTCGYCICEEILSPGDRLHYKTDHLPTGVGTTHAPCGT